MASEAKDHRIMIKPKSGGSPWFFCESQEIYFLLVLPILPIPDDSQDSYITFESREVLSVKCADCGWSF